ncbi:MULTISPECIES: type IV pilus biogenesis protein PilP [Dickeya]|uniref:Type IV pilus biogenesis protein PilP n=1 Tax=Dickeya oryzae TaxID=1240404 RepID=A0AB39IN23_9GAMM|nr:MULTISPECIES: type IV pilus biogenesis protein PilP [Dickeya]MCA6985497.1 type IV pilus biogenesis protein PilP [Dickeya zeae]MCA6990824.1 type IV pilus biogenesis protein PilP [Dickeya oryzae]WOY03080.1 type IV pilus biogenesis protein PilP [Dickeya fangzhongdai]
MRKNNPIWPGGCLALFLFTGSAPVWAMDDGSNVTMGELETAQARNMLLEQQVQTARLQRQLRESQTDAATAMTSIPSIPSTSPLSMPVSPSMTPSSPLSIAQEKAGIEPSTVKLQEIYGRGNQLRARILLPRGGVTEVAVGDPIPGTKTHVQSITATAVKLSDGSELSF